MPLFVKDNMLCYKECNTAFLTLLGKRKSEVIGKTSAEIFDEETAKHINKNDIKIIKKLKDQFYTETIQTSEGVKVFDFHKSPIVIDGIFNGIVGIAIDVTKREKKQKNLNKRIKKEVKKNLTQEKQHLQDRMNDIKYAEIGKLSAGITHEINTPLTYIKANIELMSYDIEVINDEKLKRNLLEDNNKIIEGIERIERIVDSMREMSQKSREEHSEVNIYQTLITSLTMAYNRSKHIAPIMLQDNLFTPEINSKLHECYVVAQHQRLEQAWIIIINNALDILNQNGSYASNEFKIQYTVNESNVIIEFTDNGGGIDESVLNTLFEPFVSTKEHGGIGIGLNIAKKIIYDHQGKIRAYNRNAGAVIEVTLPAVK